MKDQKNTSNPNAKKISRRDFMASTAAIAAFTVLPRHVLGAPPYKPPSEKLNIASVGAGGRAASDINGCSSENIVALCDVDWRRAAGTFKKYPHAKKYRDFRKMLEKEDKNIDAVIVATPDHIHAVAAMWAIKMRKHVYVEKPLTHTVYEARLLTQAAREYKVATQMGNQGHSGEGVRLICEWIWDGAIGPVRQVNAWTNRPIWPQGIDRPKETPPVPKELDWDLWLGPAPHRPYHPCYLPFNWRGWWDFGTGALGDMACHLLDPVFSALKLRYPLAVQACATKVNKETYPLASIVRYEFPARGNMPPLKLNWYDGGMKPPRPDELEPGRKMTSVIFIGDQGKLMCGEYGDNPRLIPETRMRAYHRPPKTLPRIKGGHHQNWLQACKGGEPACSNFDYAGPMAETVVMGNLAIRRLGKKLLWDGENMKVTNDEEANKYVRLPYRQGWAL